MTKSLSDYFNGIVYCIGTVIGSYRITLELSKGIKRIHKTGLWDLK